MKKNYEPQHAAPEGKPGALHWSVPGGRAYLSIDWSSIVTKKGVLVWPVYDSLLEFDRRFVAHMNGEGDLPEIPAGARLIAEEVDDDPVTAELDRVEMAGASRSDAETSEVSR